MISLTCGIQKTKQMKEPTESGIRFINTENNMKTARGEENAGMGKMGEGE